ncbi:hypothetical protein PR202_gb06848 [Eleusine coracana subsp. coracana]|uniref:FBD domain-containing protein n=1 Tax=Eleusine coracana subsp. coracana TaxID=191504 RepID=A0AAV5E879_ELECO|nr:hypothetical protein PR202_gb06848 [Eleusine coracana subsp. coracana]
MPSVKVLALEDVDRMHINDFLRCFPRLEKLYLKGSQGIFRSEGTYGVKLNPIECFELYLRRIVFNGYKGDTSDVKLVKFFLTKARVLESISFRFSTSNNNVCSEEEWIADQRFRMRLNNRASESAKLSFAHDEGYRNDDVYCCGKYASDVTDHIHYY